MTNQQIDKTKERDMWDWLTVIICGLLLLNSTRTKNSRVVANHQLDKPKKLRWLGGLLSILIYVLLLVSNVFLVRNMALGVAIWLGVAVAIPFIAIAITSCKLRSAKTEHNTVPLLKTQLLAIKSLFSITLGFLAFAALFQGSNDQKIIESVLPAFLFLCVSFGPLYFLRSHKLHIMESQKL